MRSHLEHPEYPERREHPDYPEHPERGSNSPDRTPSGRLVSGVLSQPVPPTQRPRALAHPSVIPPVAPLPAPSVPDALSEWSDLAPTEPQIPSLPRLPRVRRRRSDALRFAIGAAFSNFALGEDWIHDETLACMPIELRMRLFNKLAPVYLDVVQASGRMKF